MHPLAAKISTLQRRLTLRRHAAALCWTLVTLLAAALLLGLADYVIRFADRGLRIMVTAALAGTAAWAVYRWWYVPNRRRMAPLTVARRVEARFPQLRDALASALDFLQQSEDDPTAGSPQLRRIVVANVQTQVDGLPLDEVIDRRPLRRAAAWTAVAVVAVALCLAIDAVAVQTAFVRLVAPLGTTEWPRANHLAFRDPPTRLAAGQTFEVELVDSAGALPDEVRIEYRTQHDGRREITSDLMTRVGDVLIARRENVRQSFAFRAEGGDDRTMPWLEVEVIEPPQLESLAIVAHPPPYTGLPPFAAGRHLEVLAGTGIEVLGTAGEPLAAARILLGGGEVIEATVPPETGGVPGRGFYVRPAQWLVSKSGAYRIELENVAGLAGVVGQWNLRVQPDPPPSISWRRPNDDLYVTATAVVPLELVVRDNLAIQRVEVVYERSDQPDAEPKRIELFRGPQRVSTLDPATAIERGDERVVAHQWQLAALELSFGTQLTVHGVATDYRPGNGQTIAPRRITIVTADEVAARLADRQAQIVQQLERTIAAQRATREDVRRLEIAHRDTGELSGDDRNTLQTAELNQRRVARMLVDPAEGLPAAIDELLAELEMNRLDSPDAVERMGALSTVLDHLAREPLPTAERELTDARKHVESGVDDADRSAALHRSLASAGSAQEEVLAALDQAASELSGWADYGRLVRLLVELRQDQIVHERSTRSEIGLAMAPLELRELTRQQLARLNQAAAAQDAIARRYERIEQALDQLARELREPDADAAATLSDAVELARRLAIGDDMQQAARDLGENRVGRALARELQVIDHLQRVLDVLSDRRERQLDRLIEGLRQAERELEAMREELAELREQIAAAEQQAAPDPRELQRLHADEDSLRRRIERLGRQVRRLDAEAASTTLQQAADQLTESEADEPSPSSQVQQAEQDLAVAARQLAERRQQAELDAALEFVRRFQRELGEMVERQQAVIRDTIELDDRRAAIRPFTPEQLQKLRALADEERELAQLAHEHSEFLYGLAAVRIALEEANARLTAAAELLETHDTGPRAQQAERHALARLKAMLEAFAQTAAEAEEEESGAAPGTGEQGEAPRPTFELLQMKMLRLLQVDLNDRTREFQERLTTLDAPPDATEQAALDREALDLAAQQGRLAELVEQIITRNNVEEE